MTMTHMQYIRPGDELILKGGTPDITYVWNQPPYSRFVWNGTALEALGTVSGGGSSYIGAVASQAAMTALSAVVGSECLRTDVGTGGTRYELTALPATTAANWQPIQGVLADGSVVTLVLVDGKVPRRLRVSVATGCQVTVTIGGVTQPVLTETVAGDWHQIDIADDPTSAQPTTATLQRTAGSGTTSAFSLEF